jgi:chitinase
MAEGCDPNRDWGNLEANEKVVVGYYPNWAVYGRHYYLNSFADAEDPGVASKTVPHPYYSHIQFAFVNVSPDGRCVSSDPAVDLPRSDCDCTNPNPPHFRNACDCTWVKTFGGNEGLFRDMAALKAQNPNVKMLMSLGGWTYSQNFSDVARTPESRERFINSCVDFMNAYGFDGIDIDWEYPGGGGRDGATCAEGADPCTDAQKVDEANWTTAGDGATYSEMRDGVCRSCRAEDGENYVSLLRGFREAMPQGRTLSVAVGGSPARIADMNVRDMACYLDWMGIMTYDFHGGWENQTGFQSPLRRGEGRGEAEGLSIVESVDNFMAAGLPASKVVTGAAFYGRGWGNAVQQAPGGAAQGLPATDVNEQTGDVTHANGVMIGRWEAGIWDYRGIVESYLDPNDHTRAIRPGYVRGWDEAAASPYLYSAEDGIWFAYDDAESTRIKAEYVRDNNYRGVIVWDTTLDDCNDTLARAVNAGLGREVVNPPAPGCRQ